MSMACLELSKEVKLKGEDIECTKDGSIDLKGNPAIRETSGKWVAGIMILLNQALATLAFFGVGVNLVLFLTRVLKENNADAANSVSKWTGTVYICSLVGAFLSDSYWGRFKTCAIFQVIYVTGLSLLALASQLYLVKPKGCGNRTTLCGEHSTMEVGLFYISVYMIALGYGGYQPNIATFGADQFDEQHPSECSSKVAFFSYFYLFMNLGSLFSNTILDYFEDEGKWALGFWASAASAFAALVLFLGGTARYRHFASSGNPLSRFAQVLVAATKKCKVETPENEDDFYQGEVDDDTTGGRKMLHTHGFKFLDRAAVVTSKELDSKEKSVHNPWRICPISQVEEVKCILRLLPIWLCTIIYSVVFTQMASLFVEQGDAMKTTIANFRIPAASMSTFDILSVAGVIFLNRRVLYPLVKRFKKCKDDDAGLTELQRMGIGLVIAVMAMLSAGIVECYRLKYASNDCKHCEGSSSLNIFWQVPQYAFIGASEVFMYVAQLEFFNAQAPDGLKSFGSALCMTSISLGNYVSSFLVSIVMKISATDNMPGWIPGNLNKGHLDRFYFLLAGLTLIDLAAYIACAKWYKNIKHSEKIQELEEEDKFEV
ncbi:Protein NRT1/ PTR FAMILY 7.3 [Capsicum annuum]|uniref:Protein NRT1/ PTR FAMILY 7.3 n=1 Tax=Capsicum annuum TaxID=4072 RepID=A0A2G3API5_CAPAN|nr:protein NRT1/ PTR FAMILY 7.3 [Capsicum annuum]KAF3644912.1 Protein NRT1/ PTR FAMILY 7.3 [Capsicum annuum]KAF3649572.1 Protein NRT1/ PTR FAMILY 7.3 [Capsicum annuum]PHT96154.1 Protein NRT1/ PTR FAMILY 7.3 [Capsicum annuum]